MRVSLGALNRYSFLGAALLHFVSYQSCTNCAPAVRALASVSLVELEEREWGVCEIGEGVEWTWACGHMAI